MDKKRDKKWGWSKIPKYGKVLIIVFASLVVLAGAAAGYFFYYINSVNEAINSKTTSRIESILEPIESYQDPVTVLLMGRDSRDVEEERGRADSIMLLHINPEEAKASLLSIPRDTLIEIPGYGEDKINAAYAYGGEELMIKTVSEFLDADINHYVTIDFNGFVELIDALEGVDIVVDRPLEDPKSGANFSPGEHHLTGEQALAYTRSRSTELGDIGRIQRQQQLFRALVEQKLNVKYMSDIPYYFNILIENTRTDLNILTIMKYSKAVLSFSTENFQTAIIPSHSDWIEDGTISVQVPDVEEARIMWDRILKGEPASKYNAIYTEISNSPDSMSANITYDFTIKVKNTGALPWKRNSGNGFFVGYHWIDFENKKMVVFDGDRSFLPRDEVAPGEEVTFDLEVTAPSQPGKYILQIEMVHEKVTWFSYQGVPPYEKFISVDVDYSARYDDSGKTPLYMKPDAKYPIDIWVKNTGAIDWENEEDYEINLGYHWIDRDTREPVLWDNGRRVHIEHMEPGEEAVFNLMVISPKEPGRYILQYDLVHERVIWFSAAGVTPLEVNVDVGETVDKKVTTDTHIVVENGNGIPGVAGRMKKYLQVYGFKVVDLANADSFNYEKTVIYYKEDTKAKADQLAILFESYELKKLEEEKFEERFSGADIGVVVGNDYLENIE
ncbi:MAG: LCP family protein [Candidatus Humimicrobiaceae bacterium]